MSAYVGVDVGGTFTDLVLHDEATGEVHVAKVPSTPGDPSVGLVNGLRALPCAIGEISLILHGTTVATNAVLERKGARCGLIMTEGFRDVLELRRRDRPHTYGLKGSFTPLVERALRVEVAERTDHLGNVEQAPDEAALAAAARKLLAAGAEVVVVSFINAYANPANEQKARQVLEGIWPNAHIVIASEVLPEIREFERTSTAVLNGYVQPLVGRYLAGLMEQLGSQGYGNDVLLIQSNGGLMSQQVARRFSVNTILSGPAAGVIAARHIGHAIGRRNLVTCDVGGTSLDIALVREGQAATSREMSLEYGLPMRATMLDIRTIGAGGGSIAWIDRAGLLQIGPHSAGADPGPACYGQGGEAPTVTDANLMLGRIGMDNAIGREQGWRFSRERAEAAISSVVARPLGLSPVDAAWAILQVANHKIAAGIRMLTVERGFDPRDFALVAYGGGGPLHACALLEELELAQAIIPPWPGITSALGCIAADVRHDFLQTLNRRLDDLEPAEIYEIFARHGEQGRKLIADEGIQVEAVDVFYHADIAYDGQIHEVRTALPAQPCGREEITRAFEAAYAAQYGAALPGRALRIRTLDTSVVGIRPKSSFLAAPTREGGSLESSPATALANSLKHEREVYFGSSSHGGSGDGSSGGSSGRFAPCPVYERSLLSIGAVLPGPAIVEQGDATTVVEPGMTAQVDGMGNLIIEAAAG